MKFHKIIILIIAASGGYAVYKARLAFMEPGDESGHSFFSAVNGEGSIGQTFREANDARTSGRSNHKGSSTNSQIPPVGEFAASDSDLINAAAKGDTKGVEARLAHQVRVDSRDALRRTPLMYASWNNHGDICIRLLAAGANPELKDVNGNNAFDYAAGNGLTDIVDLLLKYSHNSDDDNYGEYAKLIQAVAAGDVTRMPEGNGKLASVNRINPDGQSPLHVAAGNGSVAVMEALIARGANVNIANENRQTPLLWAAWNNQPAAVEVLVKHGADMSKTDLGGNTPLIMAVQNKSVAAAKVLIQNGADKYVANKQGKNAAIIAEDNNLKELADLLK